MRANHHIRVIRVIPTVTHTSGRLGGGGVGASKAENAGDGVDGLCSFGCVFLAVLTRTVMVLEQEHHKLGDKW